MLKYYYRLFVKLLNSVSLRINSFLVKKLLGDKKTAHDKSLLNSYNNCTIHKEKHTVLNSDGKVLIRHLIPATYGNPYIHLSFLSLLKVFLKSNNAKAASIGEAFIWGNAWSNGYYHFVSEDLPKLLYNEKTGIPSYTWPSNTPKWKQQLFELFDIKNNIISEPTAVKKAYYIQNNRVYSAKHNRNIVNPDLIDTFKESLLTIVKDWDAKILNKDIVWISRKYTYDRHIVNEDECIREIEKAGIKITVIYPEKLTVLQQIASVYYAPAIIGPHGAGLTNIMFTNNANMIEIGPQKRINNSFISVTVSLNRQYNYISATPTNRLFKNRSTLQVNPETIVKQIQEIISSYKAVTV